MKFNKWTLGLAAVGAVSLTSAVRADEAKITPLQTALSNTTISGYVDTAAQYNLGNQGTEVQVPAGTAGSKVDSFSLNTLDIAIDKPEDSTPWASGYHFDLNYGTDAVNATGSGTDAFGVRQAYVVVRTPVGNGIDWKFGVQDDIIGYEGNTDSANPNYTRSVGYSLEPTTLTGLIGTYQVCSAITVQGGIANETFVNGYVTPGTTASVSDKTLAAAVALTAPDSWGWLKGGTLNAGTLLNLEKGGQNNFYAGLTIPTPWSILKVGSSLDVVSIANSLATNHKSDSGEVLGVYGNIQATDKLAFNLRGEVYNLKGDVNPYTVGHPDGAGEELTATVAYNLWANVTSRAEIRWDHSDAGDSFGGGAPSTPTVNSYILAINLIYTF